MSEISVCIVHAKYMLPMGCKYILNSYMTYNQFLRQTNIDALPIIGALKVICPEFQVIRGFSQKIPADLLSYDQIHS